MGLVGRNETISVTINLTQILTNTNSPIALTANTCLTPPNAALAGHGTEFRVADSGVRRQGLIDGR